MAEDPRAWFNNRLVYLSRQKRFWLAVDVSDLSGCWEWTHTRSNKGYGVTCISGRVNTFAHRMAWHLTNGPIPDGLFVCHHCDNPPCVRPDHLFLGDVKANMEDMVQKGRARKATIGSIKDMGDGAWLLRVGNGKDPETGKYTQRSRIFRGSRAEAEKALRSLVDETRKAA